MWAMDRVDDELFDGRRLWVLTVVDAWSRICPVNDARTRICKARLAES
jgi:putative transposase